MDRTDNSEKTVIPIFNPYERSEDTPVLNSIMDGYLMTMKYLSLILLTGQNAILSILMRLVRTQPELFITSTAVLLAESIKLLVSVAAVVGLDARCDYGLTLRIFKRCILEQPLDTLKVSIPSFLYFVQNNLLYIGATYLDAATCQVTYQLKILTTALFSVLLLNKRLHPHQWVALVLLFVGVALVQVAQLYAPHNQQMPAAGESSHPLLGLAAVVAACCLSGLAGVYFEKILKGSLETTVWMRNVQLCLTSVPVGLFSVYVYGSEEVAEKGFFFGYTRAVWMVIVLQAFGGILVALVVNFADNILKGFATSLAIVLSSLLSMHLFHFRPTPSFVAGAALVMASIFLYSKKPRTDK